MTQTKLAAVVDEAVELDRTITQLQDKLKDLKEMLITEAESREEERLPGEGGGERWTATGTDGCMARVSFPAPSLKSSIDAERPEGAKTMELVGRHKEDLFTPRLVYVPVANFRDRCAQIFDAGKSRKIIRSCETASRPRVAFETKTPEPK